MRKKTFSVGLAAVAAAVLVPLMLFQVTTASAAGKTRQHDQAGTVTIQSWVYAVPSENVLSGTLWACTKINRSCVPADRASRRPDRCTAVWARRRGAWL